MKGGIRIRQIGEGGRQVKSMQGRVHMETCGNVEALKSLVYLVNCKKVGSTGCAVGDKSGKLNRNYFKNDLE